MTNEEMAMRNAEWIAFDRAHAEFYAEERRLGAPDPFDNTGAQKPISPEQSAAIHAAATEAARKRYYVERERMGIPTECPNTFEKVHGKAA